MTTQSNIEANIQTIQDQINQTAQNCGRPPEDIALIAVSKRKPAGMIQETIDAGHKNFGENYIQEAMEKIDTLGRDAACWHFIGHLQSNKAKFAVKYFDLIHTVDKFKLAKEISKQAAKYGKVQDILLQVNIAEEETKSGAKAEEITQIAQQVAELENVRIKGLMCMPPFFDDPEAARPYFRQARELAQALSGLNHDKITMEHLSMGMSNDFQVAIEEGATFVRVGTAIFGSRD